MATVTIRKRYTGPATDDPIFDCPASPHRTRVTGVMLTTSASNTLNPDVTVRCGARYFADHPGIPPGGGIAFNEVTDTLAGGQITVSTTDPGGTLAVIIYARTDE